MSEKKKIEKKGLFIALFSAGNNINYKYLHVNYSREHQRQGFKKILAKGSFYPKRIFSIALTCMCFFNARPIVE